MWKKEESGPSQPEVWGSRAKAGLERGAPDMLSRSVFRVFEAYQKFQQSILTARAVEVVTAESARAIESSGWPSRWCFSEWPHR